MARTVCKLNGGDKAILRKIVGWIHVGESDSTVRRQVLRKLGKAKDAKAKCLHTKALRYAVEEHHRNQKQYNRIMRGF